MDPLLAAGVLLCVAAITPGPNNLVVLRAAGHAGLRGAMPAIAGIVCGGLLLLAVTALGAGTAFATYPPLRRCAGMLGSLYLVWLGISLCLAGMRSKHSASTATALPAGMPGLIGFQFLNPKSWVIVLTVLATMPASGLRDGLLLAGLFVLVPTLCLLLWAVLGAWLARWLTRPTVRRSVDIVMGTLLVACAFLLLIEP
ncbi:MAG TPA: LysE family translocator [Rhodanobacter sp.]|nr:LysE family translocator [Rhodanobacter sp.]